MDQVESGAATDAWSKGLHDRVNSLVGLSSTSSVKYDEFKQWLGDQFEANSSVCYLSDFGKQWVARVGQALMGLPTLLVLLIEGEPQEDVVSRLERLHGYATGLQATLLFFGREGSWTLEAVVGVPSRPVYDSLRGVVSDGSDASVPSIRARSARIGGRFFDLEPDAQAALAWKYLVGLGGMPNEEAIGIAARALRAEGLLDYGRLRSDGLVYSELESAIRYASRRGFLFDRPRNGHVRAVKCDADEFTRDDWRACLLAVMTEGTWTDRDVVIRDAAARAVATFGLNMVRLRGGGRVDSALRSAMNGLIRLGCIERGQREQIRRTDVDVTDRNKDLAEDAELTVTAQAKEMVVDELGSTSGPHPSTPEQLRKLVGHLPPEAEPVFAHMLALSPKSTSELRELVAVHMAKFEREFETQEFLDFGGATLLAQQCERLLASWDELEFNQRRLAQAAIDFFVTSDEVDNDFVLDGLRTDKAVMNAVIEAVT